MSDRAAVLFAALILLAVGADWALNGASALTFLGRRLIELIGWVAFWR